jgi:hypothetical protein
MFDRNIVQTNLFYGYGGSMKTVHHSMIHYGVVNKIWHLVMQCRTVVLSG